MKKHVSLSSLAAAIVVVLANTLALADLDTRLSVVGCCSAHALLDLAGHGQESLLDVAGILCGGLEERNAEAVSELLRWVLVSGCELRQRPGGNGT